MAAHEAADALKCEMDIVCEFDKIRMEIMHNSNQRAVLLDKKDVPVFMPTVERLLLNLDLLIFYIRTIQDMCEPFIQQKWNDYNDQFEFVFYFITQCLADIERLKETAFSSSWYDTPIVNLGTIFTEFSETLRKIDVFPRANGVFIGDFDKNNKPALVTATEKILSELGQSIKLLHSIRFNRHHGRIVIYQIPVNSELRYNSICELINSLITTRGMISTINQEMDRVTDETWSAFIKLRLEIIYDMDHERCNLGTKFLRYCENTCSFDKEYSFDDRHFQEALSPVIRVLSGTDLAFFREKNKCGLAINFFRNFVWVRNIHKVMNICIQDLTHFIDVLKSIEIYNDRILFDDIPKEKTKLLDICLLI